MVCVIVVIAMVENTEVKEAVESRTSFTDVYIDSDEHQFVYAMINDNTGMKFELPLGFTQDKDEDDVSYLVWEDHLFRQVYYFHFLVVYHLQILLQSQIHLYEVV